MGDSIIARAPGKTNDTNPRTKRNEKQAFSAGAYVPGLDDEPTVEQQAAEMDRIEHATQGSTATDTTYGDPVTGVEVERTDIEFRAGVESLAHLNKEIDDLMVEFAPLSTLFRGNAGNADAVRKRHRSVIGKRIEVDYAAKNPTSKAMAQDQVERWAGADESHGKFCDDLDMKSIRYEQLRAQKEALEARRDSRLTELSYVGKEISARVG